MCRKIMQIFVSITLIATILLPTVANASYYCFYAGDNNFDDIVDISDVAALRGYIIGVYEPEDLTGFLMASDVNEDENIDIIDVAIMRSTIIGNTELKIIDYQNDKYNLSINGEDYILDGEIVKDFPQGISFENKTLTLDNVNLVIDNEDGLGIICDDDLSINLIGENTITCNEDGDVAIGILGKTNISGEGSLSVTNFDYGIYAISDLYIGSNVYVLANMHGIASDKDAIINDCRVAVDGALYGIGADNIIIDNVRMNVVGILPFVAYESATVSDSTVKLVGVSGIISRGDLTFDNCDLAIYGNDEMGSLSRYVGIAALGNIEFINTQGIVEGTDAAISLTSLPPDENFKICFENTNINENYQVGFFIADEEDWPYQYAEITDGAPIYDGDNITNIVTKIELEKAE